MQATNYCFCNPFLGAVRGGTGGRACGETVLLTWLLGVSRGDTWLFLPDLVEVQDVGACVMRLWSHVVAPVFHELLCLDGCVPRCCFRIVFDSAGSAGVVSSPTLFASTFAGVPAALLFEFIAYLTGLNSNPSGSSDPRVAARPSGSLAGVWEVGSLHCVHRRGRYRI
ncbi:hypothetical protein Taro_049405 [Colocasia esculenta]|uniref:Uncharacterized protein n=1 Tax=Colocasia esculenta TaxID=4460 RepID=A0A843XAZ1_COLES|nr:hypothetical protein [Colocasia esculenta]